LVRNFLSPGQTVKNLLDIDNFSSIVLEEMSKTKNNHYLSQHISKNFRVNNGMPFWEYDCATQIGPKQRSSKRLFAARNLWGQRMEDTINNEFENDLARELKLLVSCPIKRERVLTCKGMEEPQFNGIIINETERRKLLGKLFLQTVFLQRSNAKEKDNNAEKSVIQFLKGNLAIDMNVVLVEINPLFKCPPLILVDGMLFLVLIPETKNKEKLGHISFFFPISTRRFLFWGGKDDFNYFVLKFQNINFLNLSRIQQHNKKCKIATQDIEYLERLIVLMKNFPINEKVSIISSRNEK